MAEKGSKLLKKPAFSRDDPDRFHGRYAALPGEDLVGEKVDGEGAEGKYRRIKSEAEADHQPVRSVEAEDASEFQFVDRPRLAQFVLSFSPALQQPVDQGGDGTLKTPAPTANSNGPLPTWRTGGALRVKHSVGPGRGIIGAPKPDARWSG